MFGAASGLPPPSLLLFGYHPAFKDSAQSPRSLPAGKEAFIKVLLLSIASVFLFASTSLAEAMWKVVEVVNGNTLVVEKQNHRMTVGLIAVVTPDPRDEKYGLDAQAQGAKKFLSKFVKDQWIYLEKDASYQSPLKDGPPQVYAWRSDGQFVNERVISEGFGVAYTRSPFEYRREFGERQNAAKAARRGLWGDADTTKAIKRGSTSTSQQSTMLGEGVTWLGENTSPRVDAWVEDAQAGLPSCWRLIED